MGDQVNLRRRRYIPRPRGRRRKDLKTRIPRRMVLPASCSSCFVVHVDSGETPYIEIRSIASGSQSVELVDCRGQVRRFTHRTCENRRSTRIGSVCHAHLRSSAVPSLARRVSNSLHWATQLRFSQIAGSRVVPRWRTLGLAQRRAIHVRQRSGSLEVDPCWMLSNAHHGKRTTFAVRVSRVQVETRTLTRPWHAISVV